MSAERGNRFVVRFLQDGTLLLVIKDLNLFEMGKSENTAQLVEKLEKEMADFANIIDALALPAQKVADYPNAERSELR